MDEELNELLSAAPELVNNTESTTDTGTDNQTTQTAEQGTPAQAEEAQSNNDNADSQSTQSKSAAAFYKLRVENSNKTKLLKDLAEVIGIKEADESNLLEGVKNKILEYKSKEQNIPPNILQELQELREAQKATTIEQKRTRITSELQSLKDEFNISSAGMQSFVNDLVASGENPFDKDVNLKYAYIARNYDRLIKEAEERGRVEEQRRASKVQQHSSTPTNKSSSPIGSNGKKIDSVSALEDVLNSLDI